MLAALQARAGLLELTDAVEAEALRAGLVETGAHPSRVVEILDHVNPTLVARRKRGEQLTAASSADWILNLAKRQRRPSSGKAPGMPGSRGPDDGPVKHPPAKAPKTAVRKMTDAEAREARRAWIESQGAQGSPRGPKGAPDPATGPALALVVGGVDS